MTSMSRRPIKILLVLAMVLGLFSIPQPSQAASFRITVSIKIWVTLTWTTARASSPPAEASLSPRNVQVVPGATGSSSAVISWTPPVTGPPSGGYTVRFSTYDKTAVPISSATWSEYKYDAASEVTEMVVTDIAPSALYQVNVTANDGYGVHYSSPTSFCSPRYYTTDASCILSASATKGTSSTIPSSNIDGSAATWSLLDKATKTGAINVTWSAAEGVNSYLVQWYGEQYPLEYGEKSVPAGTTSATISGLTGSKLYYIKVLALGGNGGYSESEKISAYASPGATSAPVLSKGTDKCIGIGDFVIISINSQTPNQADKLTTKAFITRFRKEGTTIWQNADQALKDKKRCLTDSSYPDTNERREYFLPDATSNFEFQVSEVSNTPSGGALAGDWSYSVWFGPNAVALNRTVTAQEESDGLSQKNNATAVGRFSAYRTYLANVVAAQKAAAPVATAPATTTPTTTAPTATAPTATTPSGTTTTPSTTNPGSSVSGSTLTTAGSGGYVATYNDKCTRAPDAPIVTYKRSLGSLLFKATPATTGMPASNLNYRYIEWNGKTQKWGEWTKLYTQSALYDATQYVFSSGDSRRASFAVYASNKCGNSETVKESSGSDGIAIDEDSIVQDYSYISLVATQSGLAVGGLAKSKSGSAVSATSASVGVCDVKSGKLLILSAGTCDLKFTTPDTDTFAGGSAAISYTVRKGTNKVSFNYESSVRISVKEQEQINELLKIADASTSSPAKITITDFPAATCDVALDPTTPGLLIVTGKKVGYCGIWGNSAETPLVSSSNFELGVYVVENPRIVAEAKAKADAEAKAAADAKVAAAAQAAAAAAAAKSSKKITITCAKGSLRKKVTGASPKCPSGYKKV